MTIDDFFISKDTKRVMIVSFCDNSDYSRILLVYSLENGSFIYKLTKFNEFIYKLLLYNADNFDKYIIAFVF
jgi:hypothetical protein